MKKVKIDSKQEMEIESLKLPDTINRLNNSNSNRRIVLAKPDCNEVPTGRINKNSIQGLSKKYKDLIEMPKDFKLITKDYSQVPPCLFTKEGNDITVHHPMFGKFKIEEE